MILSMQTAFAACKQSFATQQKKVATISKKKVAGGKKKIYRKASMRKYSGSYNIVVFLTICISYANNCFTL